MPSEPNSSLEIPAGLGTNPSASFDPTRSRLARPRGNSTQDTLRLPPDSGDETQAAGADIPVLPSTPVPSAPAANAFILGTVVGRGGMGDVWEGQQVSLARTVAIKRVRSDIAGGNPLDPEWNEVVGIFRQEALTTGRLEHPNIVPVYDYGMDDRGYPQLAMKLVRGNPWNDLIRHDSGLPVPDFLSKHLPILISMAQAVAYSHSRGIVHRDLKPSQVMVGEFGEVLLMDWGLAISVGESVGPGTADSLIAGTPSRDTASSPSGTPSYMAPEQTASTAHRIGTWTDVYLLGGTLYYLLTLTPVHKADTAQAAFLRAASGLVERPQDRAPDREIPRELAELALRALAVKPESRPAGVPEFIQSLQDYISGAGRRREAAELVAQARERMARDDGGYSKFAETLATLDKARAAWPATPGIEDTREEAHAAYARAAVRHGDLVLAALQAESLSPGSTRAALEASIREEEARRARIAGQRRGAFIAIAVLLGIVVVGFLALRETRAREEASRAREAQQRETAALLDRLNALRTSEEALAAEMARDIPLPETRRRMDRDLDSSLRKVDRGHAGELLARRAALQRERASLSASPILAGKVSQEPPALYLAEANLRAADARTSTTIMEAYGKYENATRANPNSPEAWRGLGIMAGRAGYLTSASLALERATSETLRVHGRQHSEYAAALSRQSDVLVEIDPLDPDLRNFYSLSRSILEPQLVDLLSSVAGAGSGFGEADESVELTSVSARLVIRRHGIDSTQAIDALDPYSDALRFVGRIREAHAVRAALLDSQVRAHPTDMAMRAALLSQLAESERDLGNYATARQQVDECIVLLREQLATPEDILMGMEVQRLNLIVDTGNLKEAEREARALIPRLRRTFGESHPASTRSTMTLCEILLQTGRPQEAEGMLRRIIDIRAQDGQYSDVGILEPLIFLSSALSYQNKDEEAVQRYRQAIEVSRRLRGPNHPNTHAIMNNLAAHLGSREKWRESLELLAEVVPAIQRTYGENHPNMAILYMNLMPCLVDIGDFEHAELAGRMSLSIIRSRLGERHQFFDRAMSRLAQNHGRMLLVGGHPPLDSQVPVALYAMRATRWRETVSRTHAREDILWPTLSAADAALRLDPPREDLAGLFVRRACAITRAAEFPGESPTSLYLLAPLAQRVGVDPLAAEFSPPDGILAPTGGLAADVLFPWLDTFGMVPDDSELEGLPTRLDAINTDVHEAWGKLDARLAELRRSMPTSLPPGGPASYVRKP